MSTTHQNDDSRDTSHLMSATSPTAAVADPADAAELRRLERRRRLATIGATVLMVVGVLLAAMSPPWLVDPMRAAVEASGPAAPVVFVLLNIALAPLHLNGVLIVMSTLFWSTPVAFALSFVGSFLGCLLTAWALVLAGTKPARQRDGWPAWLERLSHRVANRPYLVGIFARQMLHSGVALEAFYLLTGYTRRQYVVTTVVGVAIWIAQALLAVAVLRAALEVSPILGVASIMVPILILVVVGLVMRRRGRA
ncbi:MAG: hypothetical protein ACRCSN_18870 [Dermatophilaceae bacterium]